MAKDKETIEDYEVAFRKLQSQIYFDKNDLHVRSQLASWINGSEKDGIDQRLLELKKNVESKKLDEYLNAISLKILPKKISTKDDIYSEQSSFYSNKQLTKNANVDSLAVFIDLPIELHIVSVLWLMKYGPTLEQSILKNNYGNRIFINDSGEIGNGRVLFKPYQEQFQHWWDKAVKEAKNLLLKEEDVTIVNLDFRSFFHTVRLSFKKLNEFLKKKGLDIAGDIIHETIEAIHEKYLQKITELGFDSAEPTKKNIYPLPIGLLTSHPIANWYMGEFDSKILDDLNPVYYGRYVDDILLVFKDRILDKNTIENHKLSQYGSSINDFKKNKNSEELEKIKNDKTYLAKVFFDKYMINVFEEENQDAVFKINIKKSKFDYNDLRLQSSKIAIYQFDKNMSPNLLSKFVKEQEKRNYIFQFLSDETDEMFNEFEVDAFEESFEEVGTHNSKFKPQDLNKFRFAVFMAKIIKRKILNGSNYKDQEIVKIHKYFQGLHLLQNFVYWEKLLTLYVISNKKHYFTKTIRRISEEIEAFDFSNKAESDNLETTKENIRVSLKKHLQYSIQMAMGLNPMFFRNEEDEESVIFSAIKNKTDVKLLKIYLNSDNNEELENIRYFRKASLLRHSYVFYPLIQFIPDIKNSNLSLFSANIFNNTVSFKIDQQKYIPYRIKFYEIAQYHIYKLLYEKSSSKCINNKRWFQAEIINSITYLSSALEDFKVINHINEGNRILDRYIKLFPDPRENEIIEDNCGNYLVNERTKNYRINQIFIPSKEKKKEKLRLACINKYVDLRHYEKSLEGDISLTRERVQSYLWILDEVKKIPKCDLFIMPELALPHTLLPTYISKVAHNQIGFVSGIEHLKIENIGYNFVITVLPIEVEGDCDSIPIIRLKNHYAPEEEEWINEKQMIVPKPIPYRYDLFIWKGIYFSTYYCYELADVFHRYAFFGKVDLIFAPVWNKDTNFYNNIVEVTSRDMHNYVVISNTSQYGDTRVVRPTSSVRRDKARITGGTVDEYQVTLSVSDIDIKSLRDFQLLTYAGQKNNGKFKPTPPDFPIDDVKQRIKGKPFDIFDNKGNSQKTKIDLTKI